MRIQVQPSGDAERDALVAEVQRLHAQLQARTLELVGPVQLPTDLTVQQLRVLGLIHRRDGLPLTALADALGVSAPTASGLAERLVDKRLVERVEDPSDRRVRLLRLTAQGVATIEGIDSSFAHLVNSVLSVLTPGDLDLMRRSSEAMLAALDRAHTPGSAPQSSACS